MQTALIKGLYVNGDDIAAYQPRVWINRRSYHMEIPETGQDDRRLNADVSIIN
jgi:hypothetical protein